MIARIWSARATHVQARAYAYHVEAEVLPALRRVQGYAGALLLERDAGGDREILVITVWQSLDAVRGFAGDPVDRAVVTETAASLLTRHDDRVRHYEVVIEDDVSR